MVGSANRNLNKLLYDKTKKEVFGLAKTELGNVVYTINVDIQTEDDWNLFVSLADWFEEGAPIDDIKKEVLSHPGWCHFLDVNYITMFMFSDEWRRLRDSGLAVAIKRCTVTLENYVSPNDVWTKDKG